MEIDFRAFFFLVEIIIEISPNPILNIFLLGEVYSG